MPIIYFILSVSKLIIISIFSTYTGCFSFKLGNIGIDRIGKNNERKLYHFFLNFNRFRDVKYIWKYTWYRKIQYDWWRRYYKYFVCRSIIFTILSWQHWQCFNSSVAGKCGDIHFNHKNLGNGWYFEISLYNKVPLVSVALSASRVF